MGENSVESTRFLMSSKAQRACCRAWGKTHGNSLGIPWELEKSLEKHGGFCLEESDVRIFMSFIYGFLWFSTINWNHHTWINWNWHSQWFGNHQFQSSLGILFGRINSPSHGNGNSLGIFFGTIGEYLRRIDDRIWWVISNQSSDYMSWFIVFEGD